MGWCVGGNPAATAVPKCVTDTATEWEGTLAMDLPLTCKLFSTEDQCCLTSRQPPRAPCTGGASSHPGDIRWGQPASKHSVPATPTKAAHTSHPHFRQTPACQSNYTHTAVRQDLAFTQVILMKTQMQTQTRHATNIFHYYYY